MHDVGVPFVLGGGIRQFRVSHQSRFSRLCSRSHAMRAMSLNKAYQAKQQKSNRNANPNNCS
jgi:hypothetical protein